MNTMGELLEGPDEAAKTRASVHDVFDRVVSHLAEVTVELFEAYGISVRLASSRTAQIHMTREPAAVATIGYTGEKVRGALIMVATEFAILQWQIALGLADGDPMDTVGEFSNMLLGRLKSRLLSDGFPIQLATPTTAAGIGLRLSITPAKSTTLVFDGPSWQVTTRIDASFESGFALQPTPYERPVEAGEGFLF